MIIKLTTNQLIILTLIITAISLSSYIYFYKKSIKKAEKKYKKRKQKLEKSIRREYRTKLKEWKNKNEKKIREDATKRSDLTLSGKVAENLAPLTNKLNHDLTNLRYLGSPVDYIAFDNYGKKGETKIYLIEIKTGNSKLSNNQTNLKKTVKEDKVFWETIRFD